MLKANELRIGNCVYAFKTIWQIDNTDFNNIEKIETYKPIPLTEDILLKCGFKKEPIDVYSLNGIDLCVSDNSVEFFAGRIETNIYYLHQLQNLYFALTGEELNINF